MPLLFIECACALCKIDNLITDLANLRFKVFARFATRTFRADLFAQTISISLQSLQLSLDLAPFRVDAEYLGYLRVITSTSCRESLTNELRFLTNQTDVEHGADYQRS